MEVSITDNISGLNILEDSNTPLNQSYINSETDDSESEFKETFISNLEYYGGNEFFNSIFGDDPETHSLFGGNNMNLSDNKIDKDDDSEVKDDSSFMSDDDSIYSIDSDSKNFVEPIIDDILKLKDDESSLTILDSKFERNGSLSSSFTSDSKFLSGDSDADFESEHIDKKKVIKEIFNYDSDISGYESDISEYEEDRNFESKDDSQNFESKISEDLDKSDTAEQGVDLGQKADLDDRNLESKIVEDDDSKFLSEEDNGFESEMSPIHSEISDTETEFADLENLQKNIKVFEKKTFKQIAIDNKEDKLLNNIQKKIPFVSKDLLVKGKK